MSATCQCGCGQPTPIAAQNNRPRGYVKGAPMRFVPGHTSRTGKTTWKYLSKAVGPLKSKPVHILVAQKALGKPLPKGAQVHHFDGDTKNNSPSNLVICQDSKYHHLLHVRQRTVAAGGDPNTQRICTLCKRLVFIVDLVGGKTSHSNRCRQCNREQQMRRKATYTLQGVR